MSKDEEIKELRKQNELLRNACRALPLHMMRNYGEWDAAEFVDNCSYFVNAMELANIALSGKDIVEALDRTVSSGHGDEDDDGC